MKFEYTTQGTCSKAILLDIDEHQHTINDVSFIGGCMGNTLGIASLVRGRKAEEVVKRLEGIRCGMKATSCPDQLAQALKSVL